MQARDLTPAMIGETVTVISRNGTATGVIAHIATNTITTTSISGHVTPFLESVQITLVDEWCITAEPSDEIRVQGQEAP